jgi:hypothetical protein
MDKMCKGCWLYEKYGSCAYYKNIVNEGKPNEMICPCSICLVKMMCNQTCLPLSKYRNLFNKETK